MNSDQERIVSLLISRSMGGEFVFAPDEEKSSNKKKTTTHEPADLVWACNGCVILIAMTAGRGSRDKMFAHNVKQLRGGLRAWKDGRCRIKGSNAKRSFDLRYGEAPHVVLMSVVHGPDAGAKYHREIVSELALRGMPVTACATVPESVLGFFAEMGGSARDLLEYLYALKCNGDWISEGEALDRIRGQHFAALLAAGIASLPHNNTDGVLASMGEQLVLLRQPKQSADIFNDLRWFELFKLLLSIRKAQSMIDAVPVGHVGPKCALLEFNFPPYHYVVTFMRGDSASFNEQLDFFDEHLKRRGGRGTLVEIHVVLTAGTWTLLVAIHSRPKKSAIEQCCDELLR